MLDRLLVERKAQQLARYLETLKGHESVNLQRFLDDETTRYAVDSGLAHGR